MMIINNNNITAEWLYVDILADAAAGQWWPMDTQCNDALALSISIFSYKCLKFVQKNLTVKLLTYIDACCIYKLQCVMNGMLAACILTGTRKFDRGLTQLMHDNLHWLDVPERVKFKVIILTRRCLIGTAPRYLAADCVPVSEMAQRHHLRSSAGHQLVVPSELMWLSGVLCTRSETVKLFCLDCCVTLATTLLASDILWRHFLFSEYKCIQCIRGFGDYALYSLF